MANFDLTDSEHFQELDNATILWARRMIRLIDKVLEKEEPKLLPADAGTPCARCGGSGKVVNHHYLEDCERCHGRGTL